MKWCEMAEIESELSERDSRLKQRRQQRDKDQIQFEQKGASCTC